MTKLAIYHADAFTHRVFGGNPAAVVPLEDWLDDAVLVRIAAENNLSETAFFVPRGDRFHIRWFTPVREVDLCGHATLATAFVLTKLLHHTAERLLFDSLSGELAVRNDGDRLELDFPARPAQPVNDALGSDMAAALGCEIVWCGRTQNTDPESDKLLAVLASAATVRDLQPDFADVARLPGQGLIATAPGEDCDFVSRYFVPKLGIPEDPVTGSAHCTLLPYWAERLGKKKFFARQVSARGGELWCRLDGQRARIAGHCVLFSQGTLAP